MAFQVLVMESVPQVMTALARVFREARPAFFSAADPEQAASVLSAEKVDVVVVDGALGPEISHCALEIARVLQPGARRFLLVDEPGTLTTDATWLTRDWFDELRLPPVARCHR